MAYDTTDPEWPQYQQYLRWGVYFRPASFRWWKIDNRAMHYAIARGKSWPSLEDIEKAKADYPEEVTATDD
jgi:hypothetical protein